MKNGRLYEAASMKEIWPRERTSWDLTNQLSAFSTNNKHRVKFTSEIRRDDWSLEQGGSLLGTFAFNSLADLAAGQPSSFSRQLLRDPTSEGRGLVPRSESDAGVQPGGQAPAPQVDRAKRQLTFEF